MEIQFHPESDRPALVSATTDYQRLWEAEGEKIAEQFAAATGLRFAEARIDALVYEGTSQSHPLRLRASYDGETKLGTLIHELAHRLLQDNRARLQLPSYRPDQGREEHELLDLFLFDVWTDLYGEMFARRQVEVESQRRPMYREAWNATLALDPAARAAKLASLFTTSR